MKIIFAILAGTMAFILSLAAFVLIHMQFTSFYDMTYVAIVLMGFASIAIGKATFFGVLNSYGLNNREWDDLIARFDEDEEKEIEPVEEWEKELYKEIPEHRCLSHILLYGSAGLGKSTLAGVIRNELETAYGHSIHFFQTVPSQLKSKTDLDNLILDVARSPYCVLLTDEIHALSKPISESLYKALQDRQYDLSLTREIDLGVGINMKLSEESGFVSIDLPPFTCIGATTLFSDLDKPLRDRFGITIHMQDYTENELKDIIEVRTSKARKPTSFKNYIGQSKAKLILRMHIDGLKNDNHIIMSEDAKDIIAGVGFGVARVVNQYTENCLAMARSRGESVVSADIARETLDLYGVDECGFNEVDRKIIHHFVINGNAPLGVQAIAEAVDVTRGDVEDIYTPKLTKAQILTRGSRSMRVLTRVAYEKYRSSYEPEESLN